MGELQALNPSFLRHAGWVGPEDFVDIINIIGCGATGSMIAVLIVKMGAHRIQLWDADLVEAHNLPNQAFDLEHVGMPKVEALAHVLKRFNPAVEVITHKKWFIAEEDKDKLEGPVVLTTDTMSSRMDIYDAFYMNPQVTHVFETRLGFDYGELYIIDNTNPLESQQWRSTLVDDSEVPEGPCNLRICTTLVSLVASVTVHHMCGKYAAARQQKEWKPDFKHSFYLGDHLRILKQKRE